MRFPLPSFSSSRSTRRLAANTLTVAMIDLSDMRRYWVSLAVPKP